LKRETILNNLYAEKYNYNKVLRYVLDEKIKVVPRIWNNLDEISPDTKMIHMTHQRTQPWKTGLPYKVTPRKLGKVLGVIPKEWLPYGRDKYPSHYQEHASEEVKTFFFSLTKDALEAGAISKDDVQQEVDKGHIRSDIFDVVSSL